MSIRFLSGVNVDQNTLFVDDANNRVGIGTDSPSHSLHISGLSTSAIAFGGTSLKMGSYTGIGTTRIFSNGLYLTYSTADSYHDFANSGSSLMRITNTGNVGIGTTSPSHKLDVGGSININDISYAYKINGLNVLSVSATYTNLHTPEGAIAIYLGDSGDRTSYYDNNAHRFRGAGGSGDKMFINGSGYVGIGTLSPGAKLDVYASSGWNPVYTTSDTLYSGFVADSAASALDVHWLSGYPLRFSTSTAKNGTGYSEKMRITSAGNVGIGTTSPSDILHVYKSGANTRLIVGNNSAYDQFIYFQGNNDWSMGIDYSNSNAFTLGNYSSIGTNTRLTVTTDGKVGIGTTAPLYKLDVDGTIYLRGESNTFIRTIGSNNTDQTIIRIANSNQTDTSDYGFSIKYMGTRSGNDNSLSIFSDNQNAANQVEAITIAQDGKIGLGVASPSQKLHVVGNTVTTGVAYTDIVQTWSGTSIDFRHQDASVVMRVDTANARVGIGTTSPSRKLHVVGGDVYVSTTSDTAGTGSFGGNSFEIRNSATGEHFNLDIYNRTTSAWYTPFHIQNTGNVGIGTTSPASLLHVAKSTGTVNELYITQQKTYGTGTGTSERAALVLGISESGIAFSDRKFAVIETGPESESTSANSFLGISTRVNGGVSERMRITSAGNVGIGTTSPAYKLDVAGDLRSTANIRSNNGTVDNILSWTSEPAGVVGTISNHPETFWTNSTERMRLTTGGQLIVGGTTVGYAGTKLQVGNTSDSQNGLNILTSTTGYGYILFGDGAAAATYVGQITYKHGDDYMSFQTNGSEKVRILANGNVGIGTTSPSSLLHVRNTTYGTALAQFETSGRPLTIGAQSAYVYMGYGNKEQFKIAASSGTGRFILGSNLSDDTINTLQVSGSSYFAGNVGIGTTSPSHKLQVAGNIYANAGQIYIDNGYYLSGGDSTSRIYLGNDGGQGVQIFADSTERMRIADGGNVGIGTTSPTNLLSVAADVSTEYSSAGNSNPYSNAILKLQNTNTSATTPFNLIHFRLDKNGGDGYLGFVAGDAINKEHFIVGNQVDGETFRIASGGNVGIGTASPGYKLHVVGDTRIEGNLTINGTVTQIDTDTLTTEQWLVTNDGTGPAVVINQKGSQPVIDIQDDGTSVLYIEDGGDVGIGTTSPDTKLHVEDTTAFITVRGNDASYSNAAIQLISGNATNNRALGVFHYVENSDVEWFAGLPYSGNDAYVINRNTGYTVPSSQSSPPGIGASGTRLFTINSSGNVGIGTDSPAGKIDVKGTILWGADAQGRLTYSTTDAYIDALKTGGDIYIRTNGTATNAMAILSDGKVGIGTTAPNAPLSVHATQATLGQRIASFYHTDGTNNPFLEVNSIAQGMQIKTGFFTGLTGQLDLYTGGGNSFITLSTAASEKVRITSSGNVGIGTTSPNHLLDVEAAGASARIYNLTSDGNTDFYLSTVGTIGLSRLLFGDTANSAIGKIIYRNNGDSMAFETNAAEAMRITSAGNVGIGTTSPTRRLEVQGDFYVNGTNGALTTENSQSNLYLLNLTRTTTSLTTAGNVGIGTTSPSAKLHVYNGEAIIATSTDGIKLSYSVGNSSGIIDTAFSDNNLEFRTNGSTKMWIANGGNVGIGTTSPYVKLAINNGVARTSTSKTYSTFVHTNDSDDYLFGLATALKGGTTGADRYVSIEAAAYQISTSTFSGGLDLLLNPLGGDVGIGTTSPTHKLHVAGSVNIEDDLTFGIGGFLGTSTSVFEMFSLGDIIYNSDSNNNGDGNHIFRESGNERMRITSAGNVGIGTTSPSSALDVSLSSGGTSGIRFKGYSDASTPYLLSLGTQTYQDIFQIKSVNGLVTMGIVGAVGSTPDLAFQTNTTERMRITSAGNVGIGTVSPSQKLHVDGSARVTGAYYDSNNSAGTSGQVLSSTGSGTDWVSLSEITGVDGTGTANKVSKWSDADTITDSTITDDGTTVTAGVERFKILYQAGIYSFSDTVDASTSEDIFTISNTHGAQAFRVTFVCSTDSFSVAKTYEVVHSYGNTPVAFKVVDSGPFSGHDFDVAFTDATNTGIKCAITNNSTTVNANIVTTIFLGGSPATITVTEH